MRLLGAYTLNFYVYRPPTLARGDEGNDSFSLDPILFDSKTPLAGEVRTHRPLRDANCAAAE